MPFGVSLKCSRTSSVIFASAMRAGAEGIHHHRHRIGDADRVRELNLQFLREAGGHAVLRDVARHVARGAVDLRGVFPRERAAAVRRRAAVGVDDDLAAGDAGIAVRPADDEAAGRVDVDFGVLVHQLGGDDAIDDLLDEVAAHLLVGHVFAMLARDDDRIDANGLAAFVFDGDLRLAVGTEVVEHAVATRARQALARACAPA